MNFNRIALIALLFLGTPAMSGQAPGDVNFITKGTAHLFQFKMHSLSTSETIETSKPCGSLKLGENQTLNLSSKGSTIQLEILAYDCTTMQEHQLPLTITGTKGSLYTYNTTSHYDIVCNLDINSCKVTENK